MKKVVIIGMMMLIISAMIKILDTILVFTLANPIVLIPMAIIAIVAIMNI